MTYFNQLLLMNPFSSKKFMLKSGMRQYFPYLFLLLPLPYLLLTIAATVKFHKSHILLHFISATSSIILYSFCSYLLLKNNFSWQIFQTILAGIIFGPSICQLWMKLLLRVFLLNRRIQDENQINLLTMSQN